MSDAELSSQRNQDNCASDVVIIYSRSRATGSMPWSSMQRSYSASVSGGSAGGRCRQVHRSAAVASSRLGGLRASGFYFPARLQPALTVQCAWHCSAWQAVGARIVAAAWQLLRPDNKRPLWRRVLDRWHWQRTANDWWLWQHLHAAQPARPLPCAKENRQAKKCRASSRGEPASEMATKAN